MPIQRHSPDNDRRYDRQESWAGDRGFRGDDADRGFGRDRSRGMPRGEEGRYNLHGRAYGGRDSGNYDPEERFDSVDRRMSQSDDDYANWREEKMSKLDSDCQEWRIERRKKFVGEFDKWRTERTAKNAGQPENTKK